MHKKIFYLFSILAALVAIGCTKADLEPQEEPYVPVDDPWMKAQSRTKTLKNVGDTLIIDMVGNIPWEYSISMPSFREVAKTDTTLVLVLDTLDFENSRTVAINFSSNEYYPDITIKPVKIVIPCALAFSSDFLSDGSLKDVSPNNVEASSMSNHEMVSFYNDAAAHTQARFFASAGSDNTEGFYKVNYGSNASVMDALTGGHTLEVLMRTELTSDMDVVSANAAGIGIRNGHIVYYVTLDGKLYTVDSKVAPTKDYFQHVIGSWNPSTGKACIFIDGELKASQDVTGSLSIPSLAKQKWFCIGGYPYANYAIKRAYNGDIILANIYAAAIIDCTQIYEKAPKGIKAPTVDLGSVCNLPYVMAAAGSWIPLYGEKLKSGDKFYLGLQGSAATEVSTACTGSSMEITLPESMQSGEYNIEVERDGQRQAVASFYFDRNDDAKQLARPQVVAHRGYHYGSIPENSIESLVAAQQLGCDAAEMDLWITTDGKLFVHHDGNPGGVYIKNSTSDVIASKKLSNGESIPTWEAWIEQAKKDTSCHLVIEIKEHSDAARDNACTDLALQMTTEAGLDPVSEYIAAGWETAKRIAKARPDMCCGYLNGNYGFSDVQAAGIKSLSYTYSTFVRYPELITQAHSNGMYAKTWTVDDSNVAMKCMGLGVDAITSNTPDLIMEICNKLYPKH